MSVKSLRLALLAFLIVPSFSYPAECPVDYASTARELANAEALTQKIKVARSEQFGTLYNSPTQAEAEKLARWGRAHSWSTDELATFFNYVQRNFRVRGVDTHAEIFKMAAQYNLDPMDFIDELRRITSLETNSGYRRLRSRRASRPIMGTESPDVNQAIALWKKANEKGWSVDQFADAFNSVATRKTTLETYPSLEETLAKAWAVPKPASRPLSPAEEIQRAVVVRGVHRGEVELSRLKPDEAKELARFATMEKWHPDSVNEYFNRAVKLFPHEDNATIIKILKEASYHNVDPRKFADELAAIRALKVPTHRSRRLGFRRGSPTFEDSLGLWKMARERGWTNQQLVDAFERVTAEKLEADGFASMDRVIERVKSMKVPDEAYGASEARRARMNPEGLTPEQGRLRQRVMEAEGKGAAEDRPKFADFDPVDNTTALFKAIRDPERGVAFKQVAEMYDVHSMGLAEDLDNIMKVRVRVGTDRSGDAPKPIFARPTPEQALSIWTSAKRHGWGDWRLEEVMEKAASIDLKTQNRFLSMDEVVERIIEGRDRNGDLLVRKKISPRLKKRPEALAEDPAADGAGADEWANSPERQHQVAKASANRISNDAIAKTMGYETKELAELSLNAGWNPPYTRRAVDSMARQLSTSNPTEILDGLKLAVKYGRVPSELGQEISSIRALTTMVPNERGVIQLTPPSRSQAMRIWEIGRQKRWSQEKLKSSYSRLRATDTNRSRYLSVDELIVLLEKLN